MSDFLFMHYLENVDSICLADPPNVDKFHSTFVTISHFTFVTIAYVTITTDLIRKDFKYWESVRLLVQASFLKF